MYVGDLLGRRALYTPDDIAIVDAGKTPHRIFTYSELNNRANRLATWLREGAGMKKGDRVAMLAHDGVEVLDAFFACGKLGAIFTPFNPRLHWREITALEQNTAPTVLIYSDDFKEAARNLRAHSDTIAHILHIEGDGLRNSRYFEKTISESVLSPVMTDDVREEDIACLIFTGGTTGLPKGAQISHRMIAWNTLNTIIHDLRHDDITVNSFPMFHAGGLLVYTIPLLILGGTVVLTREFEAAQALTLLEDYAATVYAATPTMYQQMTAAPNWQACDLSSLRFCTSGGAPLPLRLIEKFHGEKGVILKQGFGMSEFGPGAFALAPQDALRKAGSIGRPNFFVDVRIIDENHQPLPPGAVGELVLRGPSLCSGYFNNPAAGAEAVDGDGWFHTGDLASRDEHDYFTIVDRTKDMYISGGENIYPAEIEHVLGRHPAVALCAVIGVPDAQLGEAGKAFVVLHEGAAADADALCEHLQHYLAGYKVPKSIVFLDALPVSAAGKVLKHELIAGQTT